MVVESGDDTITVQVMLMVVLETVVVLLHHMLITRDGGDGTTSTIGMDLLLQRGD